MNRLTIIIIGAIIALLSGGCSYLAPSHPQIVVAGHGNTKIQILDMGSKEVVWSYDLERGEECNSIHLVDGGSNILFSTILGAKLVSIETQELLWRYDAKEAGYKNGEVHSVYPLSDGGFSLFVSGKNAHVVEFSADREAIKVIDFDGGSNNKRAQFRQALLTTDGDYLIPSFPKKGIIRLSRDGELLDSYHLGDRVFSIREAQDGSLLMGFGDSHKYLVYDAESKEITREIDSFKGDSIELLYTSQFEQIGNDRYMVANWSGHNKKRLERPAPQLIEFNGEGEISWMWDNEDIDLGQIAAFAYSKRAVVK